MKKIIIGFIVGVLIASAFPAAADTIYKKLTATERLDYSLEIDGSEVKLNSSITTIGGSAYLPLRDIGNALGKDVGFKEGVISLDTKDELINPQDSLKELEDSIATLNGNIKGFEEYIESLNGDPENAKKIESALNAIEVTSENVRYLERKVEDLKTKYPELN